MNPGFWAGKRVFLTGHTGFKGGWLAIWLHSLGAEVTGYALPPDTSPNLFELVRLSHQVNSIEADVRDAERLGREVTAARPEIVFHLAAQSLVLRSYRDPVGTYSTNVLGTANLLQAIRSLPSVKAVVVVTTDKCYENTQRRRAFREGDALGGHDPYSSSKACAELVTAAFHKSFFSAEHGSSAIGVASARAGNVIGGGDWASDRLLPDIVRAATQRTPVYIRRPDAVRPWQHVLEPLSGYLLLAEKLCGDPERYSSAWNFGPDAGEARAVGWIVQRAIELWGDGASYVLDERPYGHEARYLTLDCEKARTALGWRAKWDLEESLQATLAWYKTCISGGDVLALTRDQIASYTAAMRRAVGATK